MTAFLASLVFVVLAEMGDKTQLLAMAFAAKFRWQTVLAGVFVATAANHLLAAAAGSWLATIVPLGTIKVAAAASFILFGLWTIRGDRLEGEEERYRFSPFWTVAVAFFIAEMGDKTQLATISLAVKYGTIWTVWMGTTAGMMIADAIGIVVGIVMGRHIPERAVKWAAALVFIAFGVYGLWENLPRETWSPPVLAGSVAALAAAVWLVARWGAGRGAQPRFRGTMPRADASRAPWHCLSVAETLAALESRPGGLRAAEAGRRLAAHGRNELVEKGRRAPLAMFLDQFKDFMIVVLIAAAVLAGALGEVADTIAIVVIVVLNALLGFTQEYRAEKAMAALKKMAASVATVVRDGVPGAIPAAELVPGDVVHLEAGNIVPADVRLTEAAKLRVEEAALTGESVPSEKQAGALADAGLPIGDRTNLAYKGTIVTYGRGTGVVVATGMRTELGRIATMLQAEEDGKTPLQKRLVAFGKKLALAILAICAVVFIVGILRGEPPLLMLLTAVSLAVAAIPEALPAVITISLALGAKKMVRQNALVRRLPAVETLGSVTYICSDKTGTLTMNRMTAEEVYADGRLATTAELAGAAGAPGGGVLATLLTAVALSNDAQQDAAGAVIGDPTETALYSLAAANGFAKTALEVRHPRLAELPFDAERKLMTTFHAWEGGRVVSFTKGAVEVVLERSGRRLTAQGEAELVPSEIVAVADRIAGDGLRALGFGMRVWDRLPDDLDGARAESALTLLGLVGLMDPPRPEAKAAVALCRDAGVVPVMITGDHPLTARAIARRIGILDEGHADELVITGRELGELSPAEIEKRVEQIRVYARVAPEQKLSIVKALQDRGQFVAMTGDGVNDAPALKRADIGVAMGITGTDVSKEASHMILLDDNFATIVKAVREGRRIFDNIRKFIRYVMTGNSGEIWTISLAPLFGMPIPLLPIHILWINLVTDGLPGLALAAEPAERGIMRRPPRHPKESIFAHGLGTHIVWVGLLMGASCLGTQAWSISAGLAHWQTMVFTVLCLSQMGHVLAIRSERESLFSQGLLSNRPLAGAVLLTFGLQMATIYVPALNPIFKTAPLSAAELGLALGMAAVVFVAVEIEKLVRRWRARSDPGAAAAALL